MRKDASIVTKREGSRSRQVGSALAGRRRTYDARLAYVCMGWQAGWERISLVGGGKAGGGGVALVKKKKNRVRSRKELPVDTIGEQNNKALSKQSRLLQRA